MKYKSGQKIICICKPESLYSEDMLSLLKIYEIEEEDEHFITIQRNDNCMIVTLNHCLWFFKEEFEQCFILVDKNEI